MAYTPDRGDVVRLQFDPASGQEMKGPHFGLVVSAKLFNSRGLAMICPISQGGAAAARRQKKPAVDLVVRRDRWSGDRAGHRDREGDGYLSRGRFA